VPGADKIPHVFAYHEIVESPPPDTEGFDHARCAVYYQGEMSPDFYGWVFPHGSKTSVGTGSAVKGFSLRQACTRMREQSGMHGCRTIRTEGAPLPLKPMRRWDNGRDVILAGDAAGVVAPSSGEGIYYAMVSGQYSGEAASDFLRSGQPAALKRAHRRFRREHGKVFFILGIMQRFWYTSDKRRERFVKICEDQDVQHLTWEAYMNKKLVRARPLAHVRIFFKDMAYLLGLAR
jgi:geranylgeranyl reductase